MGESIILTFQFFLGAVFMHLLLCRVSASRFMFKGLGIGLLAVLLMIFFQFQKKEIDLISLYLLGTGWLAYLMFFINLLNSVTLKMLSALSESRNEVLLNTDFDNFFSEENGLASRIDSMIENGFLESRNDELSLTSRSLFMVWCVSLLRKIFSMKT